MAEQRTHTQAGPYGEAQAGAFAEIDRLVGILQARTAEVGAHQALADIGALIAGLGADERAGLLAAALWRLACQIPEPGRPA